MTRTLYLYGCPVGEHDARWLVDRLEEDGGEDATTAAAAIAKALEHRVQALALSAVERTAILAVLDDPPAGLAELHGRLLRDLR